MAVSQPHRANPERLGAWAAFAGCAAQLGGLAWDAILHQRDPALAGSESVLSITNPGHLLIMVGLALTAAGMIGALSFTGGSRLRSLPRQRGAVLGGIVLLALAVTTGGVVLTTESLSGLSTHGHAGGASAGAHGHEVTPMMTGPVAEELRAILREQGTEKALDRLEELAANDPALLGEAHSYAHDIGRYSFTHYGTAKQAFSRCRELFQSGCYHGVLEAHFEANPSVRPEEIAGLCDATVSAGASFALRFQCVHGLGHGLTSHFEHDIVESLAACDYLATEWDRRSCYGGVFMENVIFAGQQLRGGDQHAHQHGGDHKTFVKADDPLYPCNAVADKYRFECYQMQTSVILLFNGLDYAKTFQVCDGAPDVYVSVCYQSLGRDISGNTLRDSDNSLQLCQLGRTEYQSHCFVGAVKNFIDVTWQTDQASAFCQRVPAESKQACYTAIGEQIAGLFTDQNSRAAECATMEAEYVPACDKGAYVSRQS